MLERVDRFGVLEGTDESQNARLDTVEAQLAALPKNYWYSPLTAVPESPNGMNPSLLRVQPSVMGDAIRVSSLTRVNEDHFQWVVIGLTVPDGVTVSGVDVSYRVNSAVPGTTYISQTRLTRMTTPDVGLVMWDDPTDLTSTAPATYESVQSPFVTAGTITLELKIVIGNSVDSIDIGAIELKTS